MKKKECILYHGLGNNGIDIFVRNVVTRLDPEKWDVDLILALDDDGTLQPREPEVLGAGVPIHRTCDLWGIRNIPTHARRLYRLLKELKPDVFHSNMDQLNGINCLVAWLAGVRIRIAHSHNTASQYEKKTGRHIFAICYRLAMRTLCHLFANRKFGCSEPALEFLFGKMCYLRPHHYVINNGIDLKQYHADNVQKNTSEKRIISIGRLSNQKNPFFALEVMEELRKLRQDFVYEWIGDGDLRKQVEEAIRERHMEGYVKLLGLRNDIEQLLPQRDLFFMPSKFEGLGIALIEGQAAGLPCVGSDRIPEMANCGGCRFLPLEAAPAQWAAALSDILDGKHTLATDPEKLRKFDISYTIEQLEQVYGS